MMTTELMEYSLTQFTNFRQLELQYTKIRDQNEELKIKLQRVELMYEEACCATSRQKGKQNLMLKQNQQKCRTLEREQIECQQEVKNIVKTMAGMFEIPKSQRNTSSISLLENLKNLHRSLEEFQDEYIKSKRNIEQMFEDLNQRQKDWGRREDQFSDQIAELQHDLADLQKMRSAMHAENKALLKQNEDLQAQIRTYKSLAMQARKKADAHKETQQHSNNSKIENDATFETDLLRYEKQLLTRLFSLLIGSFHNHDIEACLKRIFEGYQQVSQAFREKLQIQYDLEDLQCQYQKQKNSGPREILIQLRGQINSFRKQLQVQKETLYQRQNMLQERVKDLSGQAVQDNRLKSFTIDLQSKLRKQASTIQESRKTQSIEWRQSVEPDEMMRQMIEKDRRNMQKILKQTRHHLQK